jgi:pectate lyase
MPITPTSTDSGTGSVSAFPGAEGFGSITPGGRIGKVIEVTNLNDSGRGSLRAAIEQQRPRTVIFRVAGTIELQSTLDIQEPYLTIAGQTAPGGGITLRDIHADADPLIRIETHDVIIRYLTLRAGPPAAGDAINIDTRTHQTYNVVVDHNSMSWGVDQIFATWHDVHDITIQWNIFSEALDCSIHPKGCHSKGPMLGSYSSDKNKNHPGAKDISFHHNLMAHNGERNPLVKTSGVCDVVNNIVYDPSGPPSHVDMEYQLTIIPVNYIGNYFKPGPDTVSRYGIRASNVGSLGAEIFVQGNIGPGRWSDDLPQNDIVHPDTRKYIVSNPHAAAAVTMTTAFEAYKQVLADAGANMGLNCNGSFFSRRDAIDRRIINDVVNGTGKIINDPSEVGGWLTIPPATPCSDADLDGMPDIWEKMLGLDPNNSSDGVLDKNGNGYTNLEEYLNGTNPISK